MNIAAPNHFRAPALAAALRALVLAVLAVVAVAAHAAPPEQRGKPAATWVKGHILVQPRAGLSDAEFDKALATQGGKAIGRLGNLDIYVVSLPPIASEQAVANALAHHPNVKFAEVDRLVAPAFTPNDVDYGSEWHLQTINAPIAWNTSVGTGVTVAILDSGIDATHPDLVGQLVPGWNFYDNNSNTADVYGHGTMVAGVVAAKGNNSIGVAGVAWGAKLMPVRVTDTSGIGTLSAFANGLTYAADHGARIANLSFPVQSSSSTQAAAQYFINKGGVVFNSAGNYASTRFDAAEQFAGVGIRDREYGHPRQLVELWPLRRPVRSRRRDLDDEPGRRLFGSIGHIVLEPSVRRRRRVDDERQSLAGAVADRQPAGVERGRSRQPPVMTTTTVTEGSMPPPR